MNTRTHLHRLLKFHRKNLQIRSGLWALALLDHAQRENTKLRRELADMTEARNALQAAYAVLATNNDAQREAQARIVAEEVERADARAAGLADRPGEAQ